METLERQLAEPFDLEATARALNLSPSGLTRLFRAEIGVSPLRYLRTRRMERARVLLERTFLTVPEVMAQIGCSDAEHFTREFRRYHGVAPREWRIAVSSRRRDG